MKGFSKVIRLSAGQFILLVILWQNWLHSMLPRLHKKIETSRLWQSSVFSLKDVGTCQTDMLQMCACLLLMHLSDMSPSAFPPQDMHAQDCCHIGSIILLKTDLHWITSHFSSNDVNMSIYFHPVETQWVQHGRHVRWNQISQQKLTRSHQPPRIVSLRWTRYRYFSNIMSIPIVCQLSNG